MPSKFRKQSSSETSRHSVPVSSLIGRTDDGHDFPHDARVIEQIAENSLDAVVVMDEAGKVLLWNRQAEQMFGWTQKEAMEKQLDQLVIPERLRKHHLEGVERLRRVGRSSEVNQRMKVTGRRKSGEEFLAEVTIQALNVRGRRIFSAFVRDIQEFETAVNALRESEERFRSLVEDTPVGIYIHRNLTPLFVNQAYCQILGYASPEEFFQRVNSLEKTFAPYERARMRNEDAPSEYEYDSLCKDGAVKTLRNHARQVFWGGKPAVQGTVVDVTDAGRSNAALRLVQSIAGSILQTEDPNIAIETVLKEICHATGWVLGEAWIPDSDGKRLQRGPSWHGDDSALRRFSEQSRAISFLRGEGLPGRVWESRNPEWLSDVISVPDNVFVRRKDAESAGIKAACAVPVLEQRRVVMVAAFFTRELRTVDTHWFKALFYSLAPLGNYLQRLIAEEQLQTYEKIIARTPDLLSFVDTDYRYQAVSASYAREYKRRRSDFIGRQIADFVGQEVFERTQKPQLDRCFKGEEVRFQLWFNYARSGRRWLDAHYTPYRDASGAIKGALITVRDLTELRRARDQLDQSRKRLKKLTAKLQDIREQERKEIAREVHDEIGQKLTAVRLDLSELIKRANPSEAQSSEKLEATLKIVDELLHQVRELSSRLRPAVLDELGLDDAASWLVHDFANRLNWRLGLYIDLEGIHTDAKTNTVVFRVLQESLTNVARHANASTVRVTMHRRRGRLFMEVADDGRGITSDLGKSISSLGILGMRERAHALGGRLQVLSSGEGGTQVRLWVPLTPRMGAVK
ncbi:MAG: PAS domain S-box protein [Gammaproteobacteria bacterium]|nr:PAS domain S-box protein [Gammaproteobacteria bacterium]